MGKAINKFWEVALGDNSKLATLAKAAIDESRAEALEEAAKVCDDESRYSNDAECCAAAIRGLK